MGSYITRCNVCKSAQIIPSKSAEKPTIKLLLLGLDNAGKTTTALHLTGDSLEDMIPTIGFSNLEMRKFNNFRVIMYDLGGGPRIRAIWKTYFSLIHGIIFVIDSADISRVLEAKDVIEEVISNDKIAGKPILLLINKQDIEGALDELDICKFINLEPLINKYKCLTRVESLSANSRPDKAPKIDPALDNGYQWLMRYIEKNWIQLNYRVETDSNEQYYSEKKSLEERIKRFREVKSQSEDAEPDNQQLHQKSFTQNGYPFKPIKDVVKDIKQINDLQTITDLLKRELIGNQTKSYLDRKDSLNSNQQIMKISDGEQIVSNSRQSTTSSSDIINELNLVESESPNKSLSPSKLSDNISIVEIHHNHHNNKDTQNSTNVKDSKDSKDLDMSCKSMSITSPQSSDKSLISNRSHKKPKMKMKAIRNSKVSPTLSKSS